jgi:uncharacterized protein YjiS (DUF1127 family)
MSSIKTIIEKVAAWRRYRETARELSSMTDLELADIGVHRCEIPRIAAETKRAA